MEFDVKDDVIWISAELAHSLYLCNDSVETVQLIRCDSLTIKAFDSVNTRYNLFPEGVVVVSKVYLVNIIN